MAARAHSRRTSVTPRLERRLGRCREALLGTAAADLGFCESTGRAKRFPVRRGVLAKPDVQAPKCAGRCESRHPELAGRFACS